MGSETMITQIVAGGLIGAGVGFLAGCYLYVMRWLKLRKFRAFLDSIKKMGKEKVEQVKHEGREVSELTFRDKAGVLNTVRIVIDPQLDITEEDRVNLKAAMAGEENPGGWQAGPLHEVIDNCSIENSEMKQVKEFIFSADAVRNMRREGLEPDEVVTRLLRASGRME
jgi:hypothetical protein